MARSCTREFHYKEDQSSKLSAPVDRFVKLSIRQLPLNLKKVHKRAHPTHEPDVCT